MLCHFMALFVVAAAAGSPNCLPPAACCLFVYFSFRFSRGKLQGRKTVAGGAEEKTPYPSHATTVSSNFQLESFAYLAPNEPQSRPLPSFLPLWQSAASVANAFCSCCTHKKKATKAVAKFQGIIVVIIIKTCTSRAK